jgi:hypothetical protein
MIGLKQLNNFVNFAVGEGISTKEFFAGVVEGLMDPTRMSGIMDDLSPTIKFRGMQDLDPMFTHESSISRPYFHGGVQKAYANVEYFTDKYLSLFLVHGDRAAVKLGGYAMYRALLKKVEAGKMTLEEASLRVEEKMKSTQHTQDVAYQTKFQKDTNTWNRLFSAYTTGTFSLLRMSHEAAFDLVKVYETLGMEKKKYNTLREANATPDEMAPVAARIAELNKLRRKVAGQTAKTLAVAHVTSGVLYSLASNYGVAELDELIAAGILGPINAVPGFGRFAETTLRSMMGLKRYPATQDMVTQTLLDMGMSLSGGNQSSTQRWTEGMLKGAQLASPFPALFAGRLAFSAVDDLSDGDFGRFFMIATGATPNTVDKLTK